MFLSSFQLSEKQGIDQKLFYLLNILLNSLIKIFLDFGDISDDQMGTLSIYLIFQKILKDF